MFTQSDAMDIDVVNLSKIIVLAEVVAYARALEA